MLTTQTSTTNHHKLEPCVGRPHASLPLLRTQHHPSNSRLRRYSTLGSTLGLVALCLAVICPAAVGQFNELPSLGEGITAEPRSILETNANPNAFNGQHAEQQGAELKGAEELEGLEYLTRGPLHEAFADPYAANPAANPLVAASPPEPIRELPPDLKPSGDSITWIPGYWAWDDERSDFIWISGLWRDIPPGQRWLPGYWEPVGEGYRWISGLWLANEIEQVTYLPPPPESLEQGPSSPAPREDSFYVPGNWAHQTQEYQWTPGYWTQTQPEWIWIPASYAWTPRGCIYRPGYWDYAPERRAVMFTPVYFQQTIYTNPRFVYRPRYVVNTGMNLLVHLFVRPNYRQYYFGDYYGAGFQQNYYPWVNYAQAGRGYDPLYTFYSRSSRYQQQNFFGQVNQHHQFFAQHSDLRPRHTLTAQRAFVNSDLSGFSGLTRANPNMLQLATIGQQLESVARQNSSGRQFSRLNTTQLTQLGQQLENPVREMTNRRRDFEIERQLGNVSGAAAGRGSRSDMPPGRRETSGRGGVDLAGGSSADLTNRDRRGPPGDAVPRSGQSLRGNVENRGSLQLPDVPALRDSARRGSPDLSTRSNSSGRDGNDSGDRSPYLTPRDSDPLSSSNRRAESPLNSNRGAAPSNTQRGGRLPNIERGATPPSINPSTIQPNRGGIDRGGIDRGGNLGGINSGGRNPIVAPRGGGNLGGINRGGANTGGAGIGGGNSRLGGSIEGGRAPGANRGGLRGGNPGLGSNPGSSNSRGGSPRGGNPGGGNPGGGRRNSDAPDKRG